MTNSSETGGRFCSQCGVALERRTCAACEADLRAEARFCHACGHEAGGGRRRGRAAPWIFAGSAVVLMSAVLLLRMTPAARAPAGDAAESRMGTTDISAMSARERADRLFNRVMLTSEQGDTAQLKFFAPMAVQAYQLIGDLDADAHYHLGMIHMVNGDYAAATAQADTILRAAPSHLLANVLRAEVALRKNDTKGRDRAWRQFLSSYKKEMATGKTEYAEHREVLDRARADAAKMSGSSQP